MKEQATILLVMPEQRRRPLMGVLADLPFQVQVVDGYHSARRAFAAHRAVDAIIVDFCLGDGNWCDVMRAAVDTGTKARVLVSAPEADEYLWSQAVWRGAYDILVEPYKGDEVRRALEGALQSKPTQRSEPNTAVAAHVGAGIPA